MKKFKLHFSVLNKQTGEKVAYRTSIAETSSKAIEQAIDYIETNWGPEETEETGIDTFTWEAEDDVY